MNGSNFGGLLSIRAQINIKDSTMIWSVIAPSDPAPLWIRLWKGFSACICAVVRYLINYKTYRIENISVGVTTTTTTININNA